MVNVTALIIDALELIPNQASPKYEDPAELELQLGHCYQPDTTGRLMLSTWLNFSRDKR